MSARRSDIASWIGSFKGLFGLLFGAWMMGDAEEAEDQAGEQPGQGGGGGAHQQAPNRQRQRASEDFIECSLVGVEADPGTGGGNSLKNRVAEQVLIPVDVVEGQGIGDPAAQQSQREVDAKENGGDGGDDHVEGDGRGKADKDAEAQAAADTAAVEIPQFVGDAMTAEQPDQQAMRLPLMVIQPFMKIPA